MSYRWNDPEQTQVLEEGTENIISWPINIATEADEERERRILEAGIGPYVRDPEATRRIQIDQVDKRLAELNQYSLRPLLAVQSAREAGEEPPEEDVTILDALARECEALRAERRALE